MEQDIINQRYVLENQIKMSNYTTRKLKQKYWEFFGIEYKDAYTPLLGKMDWFVIGVSTGIVLLKFSEITFGILEMYL